ncbi:MAG: hypothetical protein ACREST_05155 [Steroidobacteraceae bacterium]
MISGRRGAQYVVHIDELAAGVANKDAHRRTTQDGVVNIGRYAGQLL